ncbi:serine hydrolase [uncultured Shewanella sp.]|uniref:serine hydrolase domain-containing protein n=1 Tax=uncultured Shewanella sp. TaxID=173975 RepID=UPI002639569F|nr:serine hydrolase domain-containing protein [uncultured Shewanella sp.]
MTNSTLQHTLNQSLKEFELPGASAIFIQNDHKEFAHAGNISLNEGEYDFDTQFRIGCLIKVLTATQIMMLVEDKLIDLEQPIVTYIPQLQSSRSNYLLSVTTNQLLLHGSGLVANFLYQDNKLTTTNIIEAVCQYSDQELFVSAPSTHSSYSNVGYVLLALLIEKIRNKSWIEDLNERILIPLEIAPKVHEETSPYFGECLNKNCQGTYASFEPKEFTPADGGLLSFSARELMTIAQVHLNGGVGPNGQRILAKKHIDAMQRSVNQLSGPWPGMRGLGYGWLAYADGSFGFSGDGIRQHVLVRILPETKSALIVTANYHSAGVLFNELWNYCLTQIEGEIISHEGARRLDKQNFSITDCFFKQFSDSFRTFEINWKGTEGNVKVSSVQPNLFGEHKQVELIHVNDNHFVAPELGVFSNLWLMTEKLGENENGILWNGVSMLRSL